MKTSLSLKVFTITGIIIALTAHGYQISDQSSIKTVIVKNNLKDIDEAFYWVTTNYHQMGMQDDYNKINNQPKLNSNLRPLGAKRLLRDSQNLLWCDEGSLIIGQMAGLLGYEYRLVDIYSRKTGQSHHTTLEVKKGTNWLTYDFTEKSVFKNPSETVYKNKKRFSIENKPHPKSRTYPSNILQWGLNNNGYLRELQFHAKKLLDWG